MTEREKMVSGALYRADDPELLQGRLEARRLTRLFNATDETELDKRRELLSQLLGSMGKGTYIEPTFRCDYGWNIHVGDAFYANFDCIMI